MSFVHELEAKFSDIKNNVEDDLHGLVLKLEAVFQRIHKSHLEDVVKKAVVSDIHAATTHIEGVAAKLRSTADAASEVAETVKKAARK